MRASIVAGAALIAVSVALGAGAQERGAAVRRGEQLFMDHGCYGCHTLGRIGTPIATDLSAIGLKYTERDLVQWLREPASQKPTAHMPRIDLNPAEVQALAAYLASLRQPRP